MGERRALLGAGAVLVGVGSVLLSGAALAAADTGDDTGQTAGREAARTTGAPPKAPAQRARAPKNSAPVAPAATAEARPSAGVAAAASREPAPAVQATQAEAEAPATPVAQSVAATQALPTAQTPSPASATTLVLKALAVLGRGPGAPGVAAAAPAVATVAPQRTSAESAAVTGSSATVAAAPPDPAAMASNPNAVVNPTLPGFSNGVTGVQIGHSTLDIPCGPRGYRAPADWYFPTQADGTVEAQGVIWLQHGFGAWNSPYSALATDLARQTNSIVVAPTLTSLPNLLCPGCSLTGTTMQEAAASMFLGDRSALNASARAAGFTGAALPEDFVLAGHSAGGGFATAVGADTVENGAAAGDLKGVVMFDGVSNAAFYGTFDEQLRELAGVPVYQIAAPAQAWNAFGITTNALAAARPGQFVGATLVGGSHVDSMMGGSFVIDLASQLVTRPVAPGNTAAVHTLSTGWINDMYAGATPQQPEYGFYAGANQAIIMGPTSAVALPTPFANDLTLGGRIFESVVNTIGGLFGFRFPEPVNTGSNGLSAVTVPPLSNGVTGVKTGAAALNIPCGPNGYTAPAQWYFPTQADGTVAANGVIWLQHGFLGFARWYSDMAQALAQQTNSIVVAPDIFWFDTRLCPGCYLSGAPMRAAVAEMFQGDRTALNVSANAAGLQGPLPEKFILTGHSAGGNFATAVGALITATPEVDNLLGVVMFDGVSRAPLFTDSLTALTDAGIPDYQIAAPPQSWNAWGVATELMTQLYPDRFNGVQIDNGSHTDVVAGDSLFARLAEIASAILVKPSPPGAKEAVRTFATGWINDIYSGVYGPGDPFYGTYGNPNDGTYVPNQPIVMGEAGATVLPAPPPVDVNQYLGKWYEQGSVRQFFSIGLVNTTATYSLNPDGSIKVANSGQYFGPNGPQVNIVGSAVPVNSPTNTRLSVGFFFGKPRDTEPGNYWILDYAPDYSWAIVGDSVGYSGYILTRDQFISEDEYNALVARAKQLGVWGWIIPTRQYA